MKWHLLISFSLLYLLLLEGYHATGPCEFIRNIIRDTAIKVRDGAIKFKDSLLKVKNFFRKPPAKGRKPPKKEEVKKPLSYLRTKISNGISYTLNKACSVFRAVGSTVSKVLNKASGKYVIIGLLAVGPLVAFSSRILEGAFCNCTPEVESTDTEEYEYMKK